MIPNVVHFVYPVWENTRPLSALNYLSVKSVIKNHKPETVAFWIDKKPERNEWWDLIEPLVDVRHKKMDKTFRGIDVPWPQYRSDITRLEILRDFGGIYMDTDVIVLRSLDRFMTGVFNIAEEPSGVTLSNAFMAARPFDAFTYGWLDKIPEAMQSSQWANSGVVVPWELVKTNKFTVNIVESELLCPFDLHFPYIFEQRLNRAAKAMMRDAYAVHIYETYWRDTIKHVTRDWIKQNDCVFSQLFNGMS